MRSARRAAEPVCFGPSEVPEIKGGGGSSGEKKNAGGGGRRRSRLRQGQSPDLEEGPRLGVVPVEGRQHLDLYVEHPRARGRGRLETPGRDTAGACGRGDCGPLRRPCVEGRVDLVRNVAEVRPDLVGGGARQRLGRGDQQVPEGGVEVQAARLAARRGTEDADDRHAPNSRRGMGGSLEAGSECMGVASGRRSASAAPGALNSSSPD